MTSEKVLGSYGNSYARPVTHKFRVVCSAAVQNYVTYRHAALFYLNLTFQLWLESKLEKLKPSISEINQTYDLRMDSNYMYISKLLSIFSQKLKQIVSACRCTGIFVKVES